MLQGARPETQQEKQHLRVIWDNYVFVEADTPVRQQEGLTDDKVSEWNRAVDWANQLTAQISLLHNMIRDDDQKPSQYESAYRTLLGQYVDAIKNLKKLDPEAVDHFKSKMLARVKELEARMNDLCESWDPDYSGYFERILVCYEKSYDLMVALDEGTMLCYETAEWTEELLATRGWCLWECSALNGDTIVVVKDESVIGYPKGCLTYTVAEINMLFGVGKPVSSNTLKLVHEAKKLAGAKVTGRATAS